jgi:polyphosphate kinase
MAPELNPESYINRELSWIEFNQRVLAEAQDETVPLIERLKFLAIVSTNLDEFFMVRVASHHAKLQLGSHRARPDGYTPVQLLDEIGVRVRAQMAEQYATLKHVLKQLEAYGARVIPISEVDPEHRISLSAYFEETVFPILTPLAVDHARPFPFISNLSLNLAMLLYRNEPDPSERKRTTAELRALNNDPQVLEFVRLKVPEMLPRLIHLGTVVPRYGGSTLAQPDTFVWLEDLIASHTHLLFPGMEVVEQTVFHVTRNADIDYEHEKENDIEDVSEVIEESVLERRFGSVVRLNVPSDISSRMLARLVDELEIHPERDVYKLPGALGLECLFSLAGMLDRHELRYPPYQPRQAVPAGKTIFSAIREGDIVVHHPYDAFAPVEEFFRAAATDPDVLAIKATLYRVGRNSPIVQALMEARDNDKQVAVLVELKARFDEQNNLEWARQMEDKGVHVTYGVEELPVKTHAKIALVVRNEPDGVRRYVHLGTGNYNSGTARLYTDVGLFTCNREIAEDASRLFNRLTGYAPGTAYKRLLVAPEYLLDHLLGLIDNEIAAAQAGKPARIACKMNQLEEDEVIRKLYEASQAGVKIDLVVRGLCCLRPGVPGLSENIRVHSIVGRYLEHSRIFYFQNAARDQQVYLGSADMMRRNLYNRVEVVFPVLDERCRRFVLRILETAVADNQKAWELQPDGRYVCVRPTDDQPPIDSQALFMLDSGGLL